MRTLAALAIFLLAAACGSGSESESPSGSAGPGDAVKQFLTALEAGGCSDVKALVVTPAAVDCEMIESLAGSYADEGVGLDDALIDDTAVEGDGGTVVVTWGSAGSEEAWDVERIDGDWKVLFDSEE